MKIPTLKEFKYIFDQNLKKYIDEQILFYRSKAALFSFDIEVTHRYAQKFAGGGKRLRPYLSYLMYVIGGGKNIKAVMPILVSIELLHFSFLVHDDIMDRATKRHGVPTAHRYFETHARKNKADKESNHSGLSNAILLGDMLFFWSIDVFNRVRRPFTATRRDLVRDYYIAMVGETILGQLIDINLNLKENVTLPEIYLKDYLKTANYTFIRPFQMGAALAGFHKKDQRFCKNLGTHLGYAYQLSDDLLDIVGDQLLNNKDIFADLKTGSNTFFTYCVRHRGSKKDIAELNRYSGNKTFSKKDVQKIRKLFLRTGAIEEGRKLIALHFGEAERIVKKSRFSSKKQASFFKLIRYLRNRVNIF